jgi:tRNA modification GTPase
MSPPRDVLARDTIVALATASGHSAIGVVRVSGPAALEVVAPLLPEAATATRPSHTVRAVRLFDPRTAELLDTSLCAVMRAPRSYTGEDVVELSCHGSPALLRTVVEAIVAQGARLAEPGEFTRRAYLNGRLDLAQAEAVALLIAARTERAVTLAARSLAGGLSEPLRAVRETLIEVIAGLEVALDFPDDAVGFGIDAAAPRIAALRDAVERLLAAARHGRVVHEGVTIAVVGAPNAGKSTLFNALLGRERAIVSAVAGTTRDVVEATIALAGIPVRLLDTAGLGLPQDPIDAESMRRTRLAMEESDALLVVIDATAAPDIALLEESAGRPRVVALAKSDLPAHPATTDLADAVAVCALTGSGLDSLLKRLTDEVHARAADAGDEAGIVASLRQVELLAGLAATLRAAESALAAAPVEAALVDLRDALEHVASLLGVAVADDVLDRIFSTFCVGK